MRRGPFRALQKESQRGDVGRLGRLPRRPSELPRRQLELSFSHGEGRGRDGFDCRLLDRERLQVSEPVLGSFLERLARPSRPGRARAPDSGARGSSPGRPPERASIRAALTRRAARSRASRFWRSRSSAASTFASGAPVLERCPTRERESDRRAPPRPRAPLRFRRASPSRRSCSMRAAFQRGSRPANRGDSRSTHEAADGWRRNEPQRFVRFRESRADVTLGFEGRGFRHQNLGGVQVPDRGFEAPRVLARAADGLDEAEVVGRKELVQCERFVRVLSRKSARNRKRNGECLPKALRGRLRDRGSRDTS